MGGEHHDEREGRELGVKKCDGHLDGLGCYVVRFKIDSIPKDKIGGPGIGVLDFSNTQYMNSLLILCGTCW